MIRAIKPAAISTARKKQMIYGTAIEAVTERITGRPAQIMLNPHAEIAMDADKPEQVLLLRADIEQRDVRSEK